jgi:hypothetical protein
MAGAMDLSDWQGLSLDLQFTGGTLLRRNIDRTLSRFGR